MAMTNKISGYVTVEPAYRQFAAGYEQPSSEDVKYAFADSGYTHAELANMLGVKERTIRRWTAADGAANAGSIFYAAWRLFLIITGKVSPH